MVGHRMGDQKFYISSSVVGPGCSVVVPSIRWSRLYLQSFAPIDLHWACVVGYGPFWVIHKEGLYPSKGDINRLMMMMNPLVAFYFHGKNGA
jgi:hypothetical protein